MPSMTVVERLKKMAKTEWDLDKLVIFLKVEEDFNYSSKLKSKATDTFGMFQFINKKVWHQESMAFKAIFHEVIL